MARNSRWPGFVASDNWGEGAAPNASSFEKPVPMARTLGRAGRTRTTTCWCDEVSARRDIAKTGGATPPFRDEVCTIAIFAPRADHRRRVAPLRSWTADADARPALRAPAGLAPGRLALDAAVWAHAPPPELVVPGPERPVPAAELGERSVAALAAA
jgi:hypothetical protein